MGKYSIFGVNLEPKETHNKKNVIKVTGKKEIFFDVFECKLNGQKIVVEKVGEYSGLPVVNFELKIDNSIYSCEAMLVEGNQSDLFLNEETLKLTKKIPTTKEAPVQNIITEKKPVSPVTNFKSTRIISEEIVNESQRSADIIEQNKLELAKEKELEDIKQAEKYLNEKAENIKNDLKVEYIDFISTNDDRVKNLIESKIKEINNSIDENISNTISKINESSNSTKKDFLKILSENVNQIDKNIDGKIEDLNDSLELFLNDNNNKVKKLEENTNSLLKTNVKKIEKNISSKVKELNERVDDYKVDTLKTVVEKVAENKSQIETSLKNTISKINEKVDLKSTEVEKILTEELTNINEKLNIFSQEEDKKYKQLLENLNNLNKGEVKEILSEKISDSQINSLKLEIKNQFQNEISSMKRYAEMSAGGGTNAVQYANGGTMNGSLNVNGELKADTILATTLLSAGTMDINFELSGFSVTGDLSASGKISSGSLTTPALSTDGINTEFTGNSTINGKILGGNNAQFVPGDTTYSVILGGDTNTVSGSAASIVGGICNTASGNLASILGGKCNTASGCRTVITGGSCNIAHGNRTFVGGGSINALSGNCSAIVGGLRNTVCGDYSSIVGGLSSKAIGNHSFIGGGNNNIACGVRSTIGGGAFNTTFGHCSTIGGGKNNTTSGNCTIIGGGESNVASGNQAGILGGTSNTASHGNSFIIGDSLTSSQICTTFVNNLSAQCSLYAGGNITATDTISAGNIVKADFLNVGSGKLFVSNSGSANNKYYTKMGDYGEGNFFGNDGSVNGATFSLGVGSAGKIVEDMRVETFALSGAGLVNKNTNPVILVAAPGANKYIVPVSIQVYKSQTGGTRVNWGGQQAAISIGTFASSDTTGNFAQLTALPRVTAVIDGDWLYNRNQGPDTTTKITSNRALTFRTSSNIASNASTDVYYLKVRYMVMSEDGDFKSIANLQIKDI